MAFSSILLYRHQGRDQDKVVCSVVEGFRLCIRAFIQAMRDGVPSQVLEGGWQA
jgi:hypothetical protein